MRVPPYLPASIFTFAAVVGPLPQPALGNDTPIIVLREDDCRDTWRVRYAGLEGKSGLEYGTEKRIPITWGIVTNLAAVGWGISYQELANYIGIAGGEIASHSAAHAAMATVDEYIAELVNSKAAIEHNVPGHVCRTFLQPGTWTGDAWLNSFSKLDNLIGQALQTTYSQSMAYLGGGWRIGNAYHRYGQPASFNIDYQSGPTVQSITSLLDAIAATSGLVVVLTFHGVQEAGGTQVGNVRADVLKALMDKAARLRDESKLRLMSLNDAYAAVFSDNLNRIVDPGFEVTGPLASTYFSPWSIGSGSEIRPNNGVNDSCYCFFPPSGRLTQKTVLSPGRYVLKWKQRIGSGQQIGTPLKCYLVNRTDNGDIYSLLGPSTANSSANVWEEKIALVRIVDRSAMADIFFGSYSGGAFDIDDVSLVAAPLDALSCPTAATLSPDPTGYQVRWRSPDAGDVVSIAIRSDTRTHPMTPTEGMAVNADPISVQQGAIQSYLRQPVSWNDLNHIYLSIFATRSDGGYSEPEIGFLKVDKSPPQMQLLQTQMDNDHRITAQWLAADAESGVFGYEFAVGSSEGGSDIAAWTFTTGTSAVLDVLAPHMKAYLSVRALNQFGFVSSESSVELLPFENIADTLALENGARVSTSGVISAIFADCFYLQQTDRARGVKIAGTTSASIGDQATVSGTLTTSAGERAIVPD